MVALRAADDVDAVGLPDRGEVPPRELGRRVDGVAAAEAEEDARVVHDVLGVAGEALGEVERGPARERAERRVARQLAHLRRGGVDDLVAPVADVDAPQARGAVEVARCPRRP